MFDSPSGTGRLDRALIVIATPEHIMNRALVTLAPSYAGCTCDSCVDDFDEITGGYIDALNPGRTTTHATIVRYCGPDAFSPFTSRGGTWTACVVKPCFAQANHDHAARVLVKSDLVCPRAHFTRVGT